MVVQPKVGARQAVRRRLGSTFPNVHDANRLPRFDDIGLLELIHLAWREFPPGLPTLTAHSGPRAPQPDPKLRAHGIIIASHSSSADSLTRRGGCLRSSFIT